MKTQETMKHSEAPFDLNRITIPGTTKSNYGVVDKNGDQVAELYGEFSTQKANCKLFIAAPELLEALKDAKRWIEKLDPEIVNGSIMPEKLEAAIAKAEGRS